jgi:hypothetical protein
VFAGGRHDIDASHETAATWADGNVPFNDWRIGDDLSVRTSTAESEQLAAEGKLVTTPAIGEKALVTDSMKAVGQAVQEKAPDELLGIKRHHFDFAVLPIVLPREADLAIA